MTQSTRISYPKAYNGLVVELAVATINRLKQILGPMTEAEFKRTDCYWHVYDSDFESGCNILWRLGLAHGRVTHDGQDRFLTYEENTKYVKNKNARIFMPATFRFFDEKQVRQEFLIDAVNNPPGTDSIIEAYLRVATDYHPVEENLPTSREPFLLLGKLHARPLKALANNGYADEVEGKFIWTGKIGGAMLQAYLWSAKDVDEALINENSVLDHSLAILEQLNDPSAEQPPWNLMDCAIEFCAGVIMNFWDGMEWKKEALVKPVVLFDEAIFIAKMLEN